MDDLASMINQFLGSEEGMNQLRSVASALGVSDMVDDALKNPQNGLGAAPPQQPPSQAAPQSPPPPALDMNTIMMLQRAMSAYNQPDPNAALLIALKPHFSEERARKVDNAVRILQVIKMLPLLKDSNLLGLLGGDNK